MEKAQVATRSRSAFSVADVREVSAGRKDLSRITSSAYMKSLEERGIVDRSAMKILNKRGPRMEPWGTPEGTRRGEERRGRGLHIRTCWEQFVKKDCTRAREESDKP